MAAQNTFERSTGNHPSFTGQAALGALGLTWAVGHGITYLEKSQRSKEPDFILNEHPGDQLVFTLPGCRTDCRQIGQQLEPHFGRLGTTVTTVYPQNGFSTPSIGAGLTKERLKSNKPQIALYAISMGGMVLADLAQQPDFRSSFGQIDTLLLDSSPSCIEDVRPKMRNLLSAAHVLRNSFIASRLAPVIMQRLSHSTEANTAAEQTKYVPLNSISSQGKFMSTRGPLAADSLQGLARDIYYIQSEYDSVVDVDRAYDSYCQAFGQEIIRVVDTNRPYGGHADGPEYPNTLLELLSRQSQPLLAA